MSHLLSHPLNTDTIVNTDHPAELDGLFSAPVVGWHRITRGYTPALRGIATLSDGSRVFVKIATNRSTAAWLRTEHRVYSALPDAPFRPHVSAWRPGDAPALALADLSAAHWPPRWRPGDVEAVLAVLDQVSRLDIPDLPPFPADVRQCWEAVAADPAPLLGLELVSGRWLTEALPRLRAAAAAAVVSGDAVLHADVRSDNLCLRASGACLIDWNHTCRGNAILDRAFWAPSLHQEGGPQPEVLLGRAPALAALVSGFFASRAGLPIIPSAPRVREVQQSQLWAALPWAIRALGLPEADGPAAHQLLRGR